MSKLPNKKTAKNLALGGGIGLVLLQVIIFVILFNVYGCAGQSFSGPDTTSCVGTLQSYEIIIRICMGLTALSFMALITGVAVLIVRRND